jgi:hypothetical protein
MAESNKLPAAIKVGDDFVKDKFDRSIRRNSNLLLGLVLLLTAMAIMDQLKDLFYTDVMMIEKIESVAEIVISLSISFISYRILTSLKSWESTYKKVRSLLS